MGYVVLHIEKGQGCDDKMSSHIERKSHPANADETRTHLNKELIEFPKGVENRTQAIQHRIDNAGITRKVGTNQVRAIRIMLSGTPEDMQRIQKSGKLDDWCKDNVDWLRETYGKDNLVSAVLHQDETTPHIHATVVPIVTGERRKLKDKKPENDSTKKQYKKKNRNTPRLCVDDVMAKDKLKSYQDSYAEKMQIYGLQRGIKGSEARHIGTQQYYRDLSVKNEDLNEDIEILLQQQEQAKLELSKTKAEIKTEKFKSTAADVGTSIVEGIGSVFGSSKVKKQQQEIDNLKLENQHLNNEIKDVHNHLYTAKMEHREEIGKLQTEITKILSFFPHVKELLRWENFLKTMGLPEDMIRRLFNREEVQGSGELYSKEHSKKFRIENASLKLEQDPLQHSKIQLTINKSDVFDWFRLKQQEFLKAIGMNVEQKQNRGMKR